MIVWVIVVLRRIVVDSGGYMCFKILSGSYNLSLKINFCKLSVISLVCEEWLVSLVLMLLVGRVI